MSRTQRGGKGPGYEYWSRRPGNQGGGAIGKIAKRITHKIERRLGKNETNKELKSSNEVLKVD